jgi:hypothetical protein
VRGLALLAVAVLLGIILLNSADNPRGATLAAGKSARPAASVSTLAPPTTIVARAPHDVRVLPANGTSVNGAGARVGTTLKAAGYDVLAATSVVQPARASVIYFLPGFDREAAAVAVVLNLPATAAQPLPAPPPFDTKGANVTVLIGPDLAGATSPTGVQPTTASTHPGTTTPGRSTTTAHSATTTTRKP